MPNRDLFQAHCSIKDGKSPISCVYKWRTDTMIHLDQILLFVFFTGQKVTISGCTPSQVSTLKATHNWKELLVDISYRLFYWCRLTLKDC